MTKADGRACPGVLMVTGAYYPEVSGAGLQCRQLIRAFGDRARVVVLTIATDGHLSMNGDVDGVAVYRVPVERGRLGSTVLALWRLTARFVRARKRFDVIHLHGFSRKAIPLVILAWLFGKRFLLKLTSAGADDPLSVRRQGRMAFWWYSRADLFVGVSPRLEHLYRASTLPPDRFRLIPNGVDLTRFRPAEPGEPDALRVALGLPRPGPLILFVGFFSREKCPDVLFDAWLRLEAIAPSTSALVYVGATRSGYSEVDPALAERIRAEAARRALSDRLVFVERTHEMEKYYRAADLFVLPSTREGLPNALLEAMASGLPTIASRLEQVTDVVIEHGCNGLLVAPGDVGALTSAMQTVLGSQELARRLGRRAREIMAAGYPIETTAERYLDLYRDLIGDRR